MWPVIVGSVVVVAGWFANSWLAAKREHTAHRRTRRTEFMLDAYRRLERAANARSPREHSEDIETAVADIQLLGSPQLVALAEAVARGLGGEGSALLDTLLMELRDSLRDELQLERLSRPPLFLRFEDRAALSAGDEGPLALPTPTTARPRTEGEKEKAP